MTTIVRTVTRNLRYVILTPPNQKQMNEFFQSKIGKILRYIFFIPIGGIVYAFVSDILKKIMERSGMLIGDMIFPYMFGVIACVLVAAEICPIKNKMAVIYGYMAVFATIVIFSLYTMSTSEEEVNRKFEISMNLLGAVVGYVITWYYTKKYRYLDA